MYLLFKLAFLMFVANATVYIFVTVLPGGIKCNF